MLKTFIKVTADFEGIHRYPSAPEEVSFLRFPHRHTFYVKAEIEVFHDDRELEFIIVKRWLQKQFNEQLGSMSCEMIAKQMIQAIHNAWGDNRDVTVEVWEDNENGAVVRHTA